MTKVRILKQMVSTIPGGAIEWHPGQVADWPDYDVDRAISNGLVEPYEEPAEKQASAPQAKK